MRKTLSDPSMDLSLPATALLCCSRYHKDGRLMQGTEFVGPTITVEGSFVISKRWLSISFVH